MNVGGPTWQQVGFPPEASQSLNARVEAGLIDWCWIHSCLWLLGIFSDPDFHCAVQLRISLCDILSLPKGGSSVPQKFVSQYKTK